MAMDWPARIVLGILIAIALLCLFPQWALSQAIPRCEPGTSLPAFIIKNFGEKPFLQATMPGGAQLIVLVSPEGSVSVLACNDKHCCFRATATNAEFLPGV